MIVEATHYYAQPGKAEAVLRLRQRGVALRLALNLPPGDVFVKCGADGPDVKWECRFADRAALDADLAARDASPEFGEQRRQMGALLQSFERQIFAWVAPEDSTT